MHDEVEDYEENIVPVEQTVAVTPTAKKSNMPLSSKAFANKLKLISESVDNLDDLETAISSIPKNESLRCNGMYVSRRDIGAFRTTLRNEIENLHKDYDTALKYRRKIKPDTKRIVVFPKKLNKDGIELLCSAGSNIGMFEGKELYTQLPLLREKGLILNSTLMVLTSIIVRLNVMNDGGKNMVVPSKHVSAILSTYATQFAEKKFTDLSKFSYTRWSTVWSVLCDKISKDERTTIMKEHKEALLVEHDICKSILTTLINTK